MNSHTGQYSRRAALVSLALLSFFTVSGYSLYHIDSLDVRNYLSNKTVLESPYDPGRYATNGPEKGAFTPYDNGSLPVFKDGKRRMFTFKAEFSLAPSLAGKVVSLCLGPAEYPYDIYLNGVKVLTRGVRDGRYRSISYDTLEVQLPQSLLSFGSGSTNTLVCQAYPKGETTPFDPLFLTSYESAAFSVYLRNLFNVQLPKAAFVVALLMGIYMIFLFAAKKFSEPKFFYFALMCFFFGMAYFNIFFSQNAADEIFLEKMSRMSFPVTTMFLTLFIMENTKLLNRNKLVIAAVAVPPAVAASAILFFLGTKASIHGFFNSIVSNFIITPLLVYNIILLIIGFFRTKRRDLVFMLIAFGVLIATSLHDIQYVNSATLPFSWMIPYGYLCLLVSIFVALALEQSRLFAEADERAREIEVKNQSLRVMIEKIASVSGALARSAALLGENITAAASVVDNYGRSNKVMAESLLEQLSGVERVAGMVRTRIETAGEKVPKAIASQTAVVEETNRTLSAMNSHVGSILDSAIKTNDSAQELAALAEQSREMVVKSSDSITKVAEQSRIVSNVLKDIRDIAEQSNFLAINAAIESVRAGVAGKGFSIVASEMRKLAMKSKDSLSGSIDRLKQMSESISESLQHSGEVTNRLFSIIEKAGLSAGMTSEIKALMDRQREESGAILEATQSLLRDTLSIKEMTDDERRENEQLKQTLSGLQTSFGEINSLLKTQTDCEASIQAAIGNIRRAMEENIKSVEVLNETVKTAGGEQSDLAQKS